MGKLWVHDGTAWKESVPSVSRETGYVPAKAVYRRPTTSTWSLIWQRDTTPPPPPIVQVTMLAGTRNKFKIKVTTPTTSKKFVRVVVKVGINKWATGPISNDGTYYSEVLAGEEWSNWFTASLVDDNTIESEEVQEKEFPAAYQSNINLPLNTPINVSAWVQDTNLNWSVAATTSVRTLKATDAPAGMQVFTTAIHPSSWDSWSGVNGGGTWLHRGTPGGKIPGKEWTWSTANPYWWNWQGNGGGWATYVCFEERVRTVMNSAYEIISVKMPMRRRYTTGSPSGQDPANASGPARGVIFRVWATTTASVPSRGTSDHFRAGGYADITTNFSYGERETLVIPEKIWQRFLNGKGNERGIVFHAPSGVSRPPSTTDKYDIGFMLPGNVHGAYKRDPDGNSGLLIVEWVGTTNPWPKATPGVAGFVPLGGERHGWQPVN